MLRGLNGKQCGPRSDCSYSNLWIFYVISVLLLLCFLARLFIDALWSPAGKGLTSWLSFLMSNCEFVTFPLVSWVRCGAWFYRFLFIALFLTFIMTLTVNSDFDVSYLAAIDILFIVSSPFHEKKTSDGKMG